MQVLQGISTTDNFWLSAMAFIKIHALYTYFYCLQTSRFAVSERVNFNSNLRGKEALFFMPFLDYFFDYFFDIFTSFECWTINKLRLFFECGIPRLTRTPASRCGNIFVFTILQLFAFGRQQRCLPKAKKALFDPPTSVTPMTSVTLWHYVTLTPKSSKVKKIPKYAN
jgi:hypothetical protein